MALEAGQSPVAFRVAMLGKQPRLRAALERAVRVSGYTTTPGSGRGFGVASMECYETHAALVCEVSGTAERIKLERITIAADCGIAVHPDQVIAQLQGGVDSVRREARRDWRGWNSAGGAGAGAGECGICADGEADSQYADRGWWGAVRVALCAVAMSALVATGYIE